MVVSKYGPSEAEFLDPLLALQLSPGQFVFAGGSEANNKLEFGYDEVPNTHRGTIAVKASNIVLTEVGDVDIFGGVPTGAIGWGSAISGCYNHRSKYTATTIETIKTGRRKFQATDDALKLIEVTKAKFGNVRVVAVDDATTDGGTTEAYSEYLESLAWTL